MNQLMADMAVAVIMEAVAVAGAMNNSSGSGGGGGGSSYIGGVANGTTTAGIRSGNGLIVITQIQ